MSQNAKDTLKTIKDKLKGFFKDKDLNNLIKTRNSFLSYSKHHEQELITDDQQIQFQRDRLAHYEQNHIEFQKKVKEDLDMEKTVVDLCDKTIAELQKTIKPKEEKSETLEKAETKV